MNGESAPSDEIPRVGTKFYILIAVLALVFVVFLTNGLNMFVTKDVIPLSIGDSPVLGNSDAPVTIYEFSDFSCPFCSAAAGFNQEAQNKLKLQIPGWEAPLPGVIREYVETGKAKIVFKYFPGHGSATAAHEVALALNEQGLFWEFYEEAFSSQQNLDDINAMKEAANKIGADMQKLEANLSSNSEKYSEQLKEDTLMGQSQGITGTPSFIINGEIVEGAQSFSAFKQVIDSKLI